MESIIQIKDVEGLKVKNIKVRVIGTNLTEIKVQYIFDHLQNCAEYSKEMGQEIGIPTMCFLVGLLHDTGKATSAFQSYISGETKGKVIHSNTGARYLKALNKTAWKNVQGKSESITKAEQEQRELYVALMQYAILAHHGLFDIFKDNVCKFINRIENYKIEYGENKEEEQDFFTILNDWLVENYEQTLEDLFIKGYEEFSKWNALKEELLEAYDPIANKNERAIAKATYDAYQARLILSILKDSDIYDSANFGRDIIDKRYSVEETQAVWGELSQQVTAFYNQFGTPTSELNRVRTALADEVLAKATQCCEGNFKLDMPVGSGKTYAALRFAVENAKHFKKKRIFYTTAFLSVLEQNAQEIRDVLTAKGTRADIEGHILEHHSNIIDDYKEKLLDEEHALDNSYTEEADYSYVNYLRESWEIPVVLTTIVQLSNTLFSSRAASIRRFCKLIKATIIIDEIQSLPPEIIYNYNLMMNFLTKMAGATLIHCTATPPGYDQSAVLRYPCIYGYRTMAKGTEVPLIELTSKENSANNVFSRVEYRSLLGSDNQDNLSTEALVAHILERIKSEQSILVVVNTKKAVATLYDALEMALIDNNQEEDMALFNLTTNQCAAHRLHYISTIKAQLKALRKGESQQRLICISTNLIEAGVDVDFDVVYRSLIGIDSIMQSAGRCNREGKKQGNGLMYIMNYGKDDIGRISLFENAQKATNSLLSQIDTQNWIFNKEDSSFTMTNSINDLLVAYNKELYRNLQNKDSEALQYEIKINGNKSKLTMLDLLSTNQRIYNEFSQKTALQANSNQGQLVKANLASLLKGKKLTSTINPILKQSFRTAGDNFRLIDDNTVTVIVPYDSEECTALLNKLYDILDQITTWSGDDMYKELRQVLRRLQRYTISIRRDMINKCAVSWELDKQICILQKQDYDDKKGLIKGDMEILVY